MIYPGYLLNPGDMFQVDVEKVMYATGDRKDYWECRFGRQDRKRGYAIARADKPAVKEVEQKDPTDMLEEPAETPASNVTVEPADETQKVTQSKSQLQNLLSQAKDILDPSFAGHANAAQKRSLRDFGRTIRKHIGSKVPLNTSIREQIMEMASNLDLDTGEHGSEQTALSPSKSSDLEKSIQRPMTRTLQADEERLITAALKRFRENPLDYTKAYKTPWKPRPYMSPFAFIPRYLEVHAPICAAVYLRHPVARAGLAEVPTPYSEKHNGLAFNWYLRRR